MFQQLEEASWDWFEMFQAFLQAPSYHLIFEAALIIWIIQLLFMKSYKPEKTLLTKKEKDELIQEWQPLPLAPDLEEENIVFNNIVHQSVNRTFDKYITINGKKMIDLASLNFLNMLGRSDVEESAINSVKKYGVGSCGPRGFYGTIDVHLTLEEKVARFMNCEEAILYSYGFATIASAIPAYSKRGDVIFCDEGVCFAIQKGIQASRSQVYYFKHNDMHDLERLLLEQQDRDLQDVQKARVVRRFLVVEGLYINYGDLCPLPELVKFREQYKVRIFMDETLSFATLGKTGRGVTEHFDISINEVDLISVSLENSLASCGGLCIGKTYIIDHQRLSGQGYVFSASLPALNATAAIKALEIIEESPDMFADIEHNSRFFHKLLVKIPGITVVGDKFVPIKHIHLLHSSGQRRLDCAKLQNIVNSVNEKGICVTQACYLEKAEQFLPDPSIRIAVSKDLTEDDMATSAKVLSDAFNNHLM